ncbi:UPF0051 protein ABCI8, chloroplastic, partial [Tanacetum coccineum]
VRRYTQKIQEQPTHKLYEDDPGLDEEEDEKSSIFILLTDSQALSHTSLNLKHCCLMGFVLYGLEKMRLLDFRLNSYHKFCQMVEPKRYDNDYPRIDFQNMCYYSKPKKKPTFNSLHEADPELIKYFDKLGISLNEKYRLANVVTDAVLDSVSIATTRSYALKKPEVIVCSISEAIGEYPDLLHAAVVELHCNEEAGIKYLNGTELIQNFLDSGGDGSAITWKYPSVVLEGARDSPFKPDISRNLLSAHCNTSNATSSANAGGQATKTSSTIYQHSRYKANAAVPKNKNKAEIDIV